MNMIVRAAGVMACIVLGVAGRGHAAEWSYEGETGPEHWAELSPEFSACAGRNQSPVDLVSVRMIEADLEALEFAYRASPLDLVNNGHTIQVNCAPGSRLIVDGIAFELKQFHFHSPSENRINGASFPLEAHLVHADAEGHLAVVAVMWEEGEANDALARIWPHLPKAKGETVRADGEAFDPADLLPADHDYYRYNGSLTTPPCTEGVRWLVCKTPATLSAEQLDVIRHRLHHANNRPVQPLNARPILK